MANAYARLVIADFGLRIAELQGKVASPSDTRRSNPQSAIPNPQSRIVEAMLRHPELIAGEGRPCTEMMRAHPGRVIVKVGAEGVYSALLTGEGLGIALKVEDGHGPAAALAMVAVLEALGLRPQPEPLRSLPTVNSRGETVGELRVNGGLSN
jgi:L-asparaginase II